MLWTAEIEQEIANEKMKEQELAAEIREWQRKLKSQHKTMGGVHMSTQHTSQVLKNVHKLENQLQLVGSILIDHLILLERLHRYFGSALRWFKSYFSDGYQSINISGTLSCPQHLPFGVPQGSVLGPVQFSLYTTSLSQVITNHNLSHHLHADDTLVYISLSQSNAQESVLTLSDCLTDILLWMESSKLKLNPDNTDFIIIGTKQQRNRGINHFPVKLLGSDTFPSDTVRNLGVVFDSDFNLRQHISQVWKSCFYHICDLRRIQCHISISTAKTISMALISSRLDYCNSLLNNIAKRDLAKLQRVQNCLARVVLRAPQFSPSLPLLKQLHWLPVSY